MYIKIFTTLLLALKVSASVADNCSSYGIFDHDSCTNRCREMFGKQTTINTSGGSSWGSSSRNGQNTRFFTCDCVGYATNPPQYFQCTTNNGGGRSPSQPSRRPPPPSPSRRGGGDCESYNIITETDCDDECIRLSPRNNRASMRFRGRSGDRIQSCTCEGDGGVVTFRCGNDYYLRSG